MDGWTDGRTDGRTDGPMDRVVKGIFVTRYCPLLFPVKCEMALFFPRES